MARPDFEHGLTICFCNKAVEGRQYSEFALKENSRYNQVFEGPQYLELPTNEDIGCN